MLIAADVLVHYDPRLELVVKGDASPYGLGAVLSHVMRDGTQRPIAFASRVLTSAEKNYTQLDKEALAIIFAVKKFHLYLCGRHFRLETDHKPLLGLLGEGKAVPQLASGRMIRWALIMSTYVYTLVYVPGRENVEADALSRLPVKGVIRDAAEMRNVW